MDAAKPLRFCQRPPATWFGHPAVGAAELAVLMALLFHADRYGRCHPSQSTLAAMLQKSRAWVNSVIASLADAGLVERERRRLAKGGETSCIYKLAGIGEEPGVAEENTSCRAADTVCQPADRLMSHNDQQQDSLSPRVGAPEEEDAFTDFLAKEPTIPPPNWTPTPDDAAWALARYPALDVLAFTQIFVLSCRAKSYRYTDISAAWRRWLVEPKGRLPMLRSKSDDRFAAQRRPDARAQHQPDLAERNAETASRCLERILARRAGHSSAGSA